MVADSPLIKPSIESIRFNYPVQNSNSTYLIYNIELNNYLIFIEITLSEKVGSTIEIFQMNEI